MEPDTYRPLPYSQESLMSILEEARRNELLIDCSGTSSWTEKNLNESNKRNRIIQSKNSPFNVYYFTTILNFNNSVIVNEATGDFGNILMSSSTDERLERGTTLERICPKCDGKFLPERPTSGNEPLAITGAHDSSSSSTTTAQNASEFPPGKLLPHLLPLLPKLTKEEMKICINKLTELM